MQMVIWTHSVFAFYNMCSDEHEVKPAPHQNAKHSKSHVRTMPSTLSKLKATASGSTAKKALAFVSVAEI